MKIIKIAHRSIGADCEPFIIAELSGNHQQNYARAEKMIVAAAEAGADAIKLQTYTADTMTLNIAHKDFMVSEDNSLWQGNSLYDLYAQAATPWQWHQSLFDKARSLGLIAFSTPFDCTAVDFLETLNVPCYKIASFENNDLPLIKRVAQTGKPMIVSTGMASESEIAELLTVIRAAGNEQTILLKCTSQYPADASDSHLATIADMQQKFHALVGLSDHSTGISVSLAAVALGACVLEKHFVLDRNDGGIDAAFSLDADELKSLVVESKKISAAIGQVQYGGSANEQQSKKYRRSIYASRDIAKGEPLTRKNIRIIRPGFGLSPKYFSQILTCYARQNIAMGTALDWHLLSNIEEDKKS